MIKKAVLLILVMILLISCADAGYDSVYTIVVPYRYEEVGPFLDGYACVKENGKWGFIDASGREIVAPIYDEIHRYSDEHFYAAVRIDDKWGCLDQNFSEVLPITYDGIGKYADGLLPVKQGDLYGFIDLDGNEIIPFTYGYVGGFREGRAMVGQSMYGPYSYIDTSGNEVMSLSKYFRVSGFFEGRACVQYRGAWGFINADGEEIIPCIYDEVGVYSEGLAHVKLNEKWGFINMAGEVIIPLIYDEVCPFKEGRAAVRLNKHDGYYGFVDTNGDEVIPQKFKDPFVVGGTLSIHFFEGLAAVAWDNGMGYIDTEGNTVIPNKYRFAGPFYNGYAQVAVAKNNRSKYGLIDKNGNLVVPLDFDLPVFLSEGLMEACRDNKWGFIALK